jgi:hypothetical protein
MFPPAQRWSRALATLLFALGVVVAAHGQTFDAMRLSAPVQLRGTWGVEASDNPEYARANFDDSRWRDFDAHNSIEALFPQRPSIIWYRLHVKIDPVMSGLALSEINIAQAFEIYVNGEQLLKVGNVEPFERYTSQARVLIPIPQRMTATGMLVIAIRAHISEVEWDGQFPGLYSNNLTIGDEHSLYNMLWLTFIGGNAVEWFNRLLLVGLGMIALVLYRSQRRHAIYFWIAAVGLLTLIQFPIPFLTQLRNVPAWLEIVDALPRLASPFVWLSLYFAFVHQRMGWIWRVVVIIAGVGDFVSGLQGWIAALPLRLQLFSNLPYVIILSVVIPVVLIVHWRRGNREAGILLIPGVLFSLYIYAQVALETLFQFPEWRAASLRGIRLIDYYPVGPFSVSLNSVAGILSTLALGIIMLERSAAMSRRQAQMDTELEAAREVQRVLVPEHRGTVPGFDVETVYEPAQQVGGDFFQFIPTDDGGLLIVVGDVAGKGLPAAMLVSVLVGAISGLSESTKDPADILAGLNERLVGRSGGGFSTALAARFASDGRVTICNAGHLSPYLDGNEVELPGALPLGIASSTRYETTQFHLNPGSRLTFYSDGVIEAQRPDGELFGFDRAREISKEPASEIAKAAKRFGQQDDITVVSISRVSKGEESGQTAAAISLPLPV